MHLLPVCFFLFLSKGCASAPSCAMLEMGDRVEIVTKLLRESYLDYPQLCECYGALSAEALWKELEEARMQWRLNETLLGKSGYLCMTPYVLQRRCELLALLNQLQLSYPRVKGMTMEVVLCGCRRSIWMHIRCSLPSCVCRKGICCFFCSVFRCCHRTPALCVSCGRIWSCRRHR